MEIVLKFQSCFIVENAILNLTSCTYKNCLQNIKINKRKTSMPSSIDQTPPAVLSYHFSRQRQLIGTPGSSASACTHRQTRTSNNLAEPNTPKCRLPPPRYSMKTGQEFSVFHHRKESSVFRFPSQQKTLHYTKASSFGLVKSCYLNFNLPECTTEISIKRSNHTYTCAHIHTIAHTHTHTVLTGACCTCKFAHLRARTQFKFA